jgi:serine/threonine-protein kinase
VDRKGRDLGSLGDVGGYTDVRISPDGGRVVVARRDPAHGQNQDLWVFDAARGTAARLTSEPTEEFNPVWSPDGQRVLYGSGASFFDIYERPASGGAPRIVKGSREDKVSPSLSPDGLQLLASVNRKGVFQRVLFPLGGAGNPVLLSSNPRFSEQHPAFSPDGRWTAFDSNESGERQVYVQPLPEGPKRQVSIGGGQMPVWNRNGSELFYAARDGMLMSVSLRTGPGGLETGEPQPLFLLQLGTQGELPWVTRPYDVSPDGQRFLIVRRAPDTEPDSAVVVTNWTNALGSR